MPKCAFSECKNVTSRLKKVDGISYFRFPRNPIQCEKWASIVRQQRNQSSYKPNRSSVICSEHFSKSDLYVTDKGIKRILKTAVPHIDLDNIEPDITDEKTNIEPTATDDNLEQPCSFELLENVTENSKDIPDETVGTTPVVEDSNKESSIVVSNPETTVKSLQNIYFQGELDKCRQRMIEKDKIINNLKKRKVKLVKKTTSMRTTLTQLKKKFHLISRLDTRPVKSRTISQSIKKQ